MKNTWQRFLEHNQPLPDCWRTDHRLVQLPLLRTYVIFPFSAITADLHDARPPLPSSLVPLQLEYLTYIH